MLNVEELAGYYIASHQEAGAPASSKAFYGTQVSWFDLIRDDPETAWEVILKVVELTHDEWVLTLLGCGELEDLLYFNFGRFIDRVEARSRECKKFAFVMSCVWLDTTTNAQYARLDALVKELGIERI